MSHLRDRVAFMAVVDLDLFESIIKIAVLLLQLMACHNTFDSSNLILRCFICTAQILRTVMGELAYAFAPCAFVPPFLLFDF